MAMTKKKRIIKEIRQLIMITLGAVIAAAGLEFFLVPNNILDGGVIGLSIIAAELTGLTMSIFLIVLNLPFLYIGFRKIGMKFTIHTLYGVIVLSASTAYLHHFEPVTNDLFLATVIGAVILGTGVGLVIRTGGALDGSEIIAILVSKKRPVSVGQFIMIVNVFIFILAAFLVFSWETAMYSIITYYIAYKMIDIVVEGMEELKSVTIISDMPEEISAELMKQLGRGMTYIQGQGVFTGEPKKIIYTIVTRIELSTLRSIVEDIDPNALVAIENIADVSGSNFDKGTAH
ncbi:YitT family protein [Cytobacillus oceanisediminis]|nr:MULTISPECIES: YitT family protein [Cytobacillus]MCS0824195.1 YitT family protein [Cytobacillus firmus]MCM3393389.1 YitT family protein [Cytobacillus oceanisediminis]MCM3403929.1 YitT family protein [Cytobacillus oceanisediminis]MCM3530488.1 YitT family protein [Cytobacillus oceanisediminis]MDK7667647.1 YitT family protein [Cytobacillus oceanisediminis]